jgi:hypothetical protein
MTSSSRILMLATIERLSVGGKGLCGLEKVVTCLKSGQFRLMISVKGKRKEIVLIS